MSKLHVGNLVEIRHWIVPDESESDKGKWVTQNRFQNANPNATVRHRNQNWGFLSFIYNGATRTRTGDNIEASLLVSTNQISIDHAYDIVVIDFNKNQHHIKRQVRVDTCLFNDDFTRVVKTLTTEYWIGATMGYDETTVEIQLASAVDSVFAGLPNQYLDETNVGRLPTTSRVTTA